MEMEDIDIRKAREDLGVTRMDISNRCIIPYRTLENWEKGTTPTPAYIKRWLLKEYEEIKKSQE